jgi:glyoxylase-like metal-dependent hydrolase (beta-lactamase superfamily II)
MKKIIKWVLIAAAAVVVVFAGIVLYNFYPIMTMVPAPTGGIPNTNIYAVRNVSNSVNFIKTDSGYIMVDAGSNPKKMEKSLKETGLDPNNVKWILLTHSDYDHVGLLTLFPNAVIYMSEDELPLIDGKVKRNATGYNSLPSGIDINKIVLLSEGRELLFSGVKVECIKAPGHTNGSMAYLMDGKYLFSGDAFKVVNGVTGVHPYTMDEEIAEKSINKLKEISAKCSLILTAHYGYYEKLN